MKINLLCSGIVLLLLMTTGCKKDPVSSLSLKTGARAGSPGPLNQPSFLLPYETGRVVAYDQNDGKGLSCLLSYDDGTGVVELSQVTGGTINNLWSSQGVLLDNGGVYTLNQGGPPVTDYYNEIGGVHILPYDATGSGHPNWLLLYIPGESFAALLAPTATPGIWHQYWYSTSPGIGGYDLAGLTDKIIPFEIGGSGPKTGLICYRPGNGFCWVIQNQGTAQSPTWVGVVKGSSGIGGFDLKGTSDQIITFDTNPAAGNEGLVCFRPGYGYIWILNHNSNSTTFTAVYTTHSGFGDFTGTHQGDRIIAYDPGGSGLQDHLLCYSPGNPGLTVVNYYSTGGAIGSSFGYPMNANPYPGGGIGDHLISFQGNGPSWGLSTLIGYQNGTSLAQIYDLNGSNSYTRVY
ncbi:hypothetical protein [Dinghuibacter silviterrae]|uniref:Uncharacterized protein n=1 Tax=Dinghuibacter silviterrae TaxID=1539049 RepID=A0A4V3GM71_9BACT|nr:hypothetical protein [Dinghuibacter silviterrae]TDX02323.1 hypothetical protein EDB95_3379 [Dinghuibacter silviterrae]